MTPTSIPPPWERKAFVWDLPFVPGPNLGSWELPKKSPCFIDTMEKDGGELFLFFFTQKPKLFFCANRGLKV